MRVQKIKSIVQKTFILAVVVLMLASLIPYKKSASALIDDVVGDTPNLNASVQASAVAPDGSMYIAGGFSAVDVTYGPYGAIYNTQANTTSPLALAPNFTVSVAVSDGSGGWFIGGSFSAIGSTTRNRLAHILANGTLDPNFNPNMSNNVVSLAYDSANGILYAGGTFTTVNGSTTRNRLAAFTVSDGVATSFDPNLSSGTVNKLIYDSANSLLYAGGTFTTVNGSTTRNRVAAFSTSTGTATSFNPNVGSTVSSMVYDSANSLLYIGGAFTSVNGSTTRNRLAAISTSTGTASGFNPNVSAGSVNALALDSANSVIYAGGSFTTVNGSTTRNRLAGISTSTGTATSFDPNMDNTVSALALDSANNTLYAGGSFTTQNTTTPRKRMAAFNTTTGAITSYAPHMDASVSAITHDSASNKVFIGGTFLTFDGDQRSNLVHLNADGTLDTTFDPNINGSVTALYLDSTNNIIYAGGNFTSVNGSTTRNGVASFNATTGAATAFDPNIGGGVFIRDVELDLEHNVAYVVGGFTTVNGATPRNYVAGFNTSNGTVTSFNPNPNSSFVYAAEVDPVSDTLYVGGFFTTVNGGVTTRRSVAAFDTNTGNVTSFDPNIFNGVNSMELDTAHNLLYVGGQMTSVNGTSRNSMASVNATTGVVTSFNPNLNQQVNTIAFDPAGRTVYAGGSFNKTAGGTINRSGFAAFDADTGATTSFNADASWSSASNLSYDSVNNRLLAGSTGLISGVTHYNFGIINDPDVDGDGLENSHETTTPNNGDANNDGTADRYQAHVSSFSNSLTNDYITLEGPTNKIFSGVSVEAAGTDSGFTYPFGLVNYTLSGLTAGATATVSLYTKSDIDPGIVTARKYKEGPGFSNIAGATITRVVIGGSNYLKLTYNVTDGGELDEDGTANGTIVDPVGLATASASTTSNLASTGDNHSALFLVVLGFFITGGLILVGRRESNWRSTN